MDHLLNQPQAWTRDRDEPCISLGNKGDFDDMHVLAPCVAFENGTFSMWYCGSQGTVNDRVFNLGLAKSTDGINFTKHSNSPVFKFGDNRHSVLTPTLLRNPDGSLLRENGKFHMWFASCDFPSEDPLHTMHKIESEDGISWTSPSEPQLENIYAPTIIKEDDTYLLWYTDITKDPWCKRHAVSTDGETWEVHPDSVLILDQEWEHGRLFYPTVLKIDGSYCMWYGSYSTHEKGIMKTALGFAVSNDRVTWKKHSNNPVFGPDPSHEWESHYTTSQSVMQLEDGSWRIWYASRPAPPFEHKYFAIGTAAWTGFK